MPLIITNGDSAIGAIRATGIDASFLAWRDVLHDGPVPAELDLAALSSVRARFIAERGWGTLDEVMRDFAERDHILRRASEFDEIVLWFEHDLYDQLQLIQLLDWFSDRPAAEVRKLKLICEASHIGETESDRLAQHYETRRAVAPAQLEVGRAGWRAFRSSEPLQLQAFTSTDSSELPFLRDAVLRLLEEYPGLDDGLSRNERQILRVVGAGPVDPISGFRETQSLEEARYLGHLSFWSYVADLTAGDTPLLTVEGGPLPFQIEGGVCVTRLGLTDAGERVSRGVLDATDVRTLDRWIGGARLLGKAVWRWDEAGKRLFAPGRSPG